MEYNTELLKEIWLKHIEVQERVLQLNSAPLAVDPETIHISGQKLRISLCQTDELDTKLSKIKSFFNITEDSIDFANDYLLCDNKYDVDENALSRLVEECQKYYIQLSKKTIIEAVIRSQKSTFSKCIKALNDLGEQYAVDKHGRLQVTVEALRKLDSCGSFPHEILPNIANGVFGISPTPAFFIRKWLSIDCTHRIKYESIKFEDIEKRRLSRIISVRDTYFSNV